MSPLNVIMALARYAITRLADIGCRVSSFKGEDMAPRTATRATPEPAQPIIDVSDIDEALLHTSLIVNRNEQWWRWTDALLDQRNRIARSGPTRERRVVYPSEYREA